MTNELTILNISARIDDSALIRVNARRGRLADYFN
jgi:hypothetical protein